MYKTMTIKSITEKTYAPCIPQKLAFIGLGVMGFPMAGHLQRAGHDVTVYNRSAAKAGAWVQAFGGRAAATPREAVLGADVVLVCVGNDDDVRSVVLGKDGAFSGMKPGATLLDHTTASAELARELYDAARAQGLDFMDAPVSGGQAGAVNGVLTIMCGGDEAAFANAQPILAAYGRAVTHMGEAGTGQLTKMVNQICIAGLLQSLSEALAFGQKAGLDMPRVLNVISKGAAQSWQMENRGHTMLDGVFDFGFALDWMRKDLGMVSKEAQRLDAKIPVTELVDGFYAQLQAAGHGRWDTSSLIALLNK